MTTPPIPDRLAEVVADAVARLEAAGEPATPDAIATDAMRHDDVPGAVVPWALRVAATEFVIINRPPASAADVPMRRITREALEMELIAVRNGANDAMSDSFNPAKLAADPSGGAVARDTRAVWHAAEVALAILLPGYIPKREAVEDVRGMLAWYDDDDDAWTRVD